MPGWGGSESRLDWVKRRIIEPSLAVICLWPYLLIVLVVVALGKRDKTDYSPTDDFYRCRTVRGR